MLGSCEDEMRSSSYKRGAIANQYPFIDVQHSALSQSKRQRLRSLAVIANISTVSLLVLRS